MLRRAASSDVRTHCNSLALDLLATAGVPVSARLTDVPVTAPFESWGR
jgi:hypothetical protein